MVELELVQILACGPIGVIGLFDLGHQIKIGALLAAPLDALAGTWLGPVIAGSVDHRVAEVEGEGDDVRCVMGQLPRAKTHARHGPAGVPVPFRDRGSEEFVLFLRLLRRLPRR